MKIGKLRHKINILQPATTQTECGCLGSPSVFESNVWAKVTGLQGRELHAAQQIVAEVTHDVLIRYLPGVRSNMYVQFGSRTFQIEAVVNADELNSELHLLCIERS
jgi:SPP1 family predicted phage head-tail adaptor